MTVAALLTGWTRPQQAKEPHIRRYSTTGDILSFKRYRRQYGYFGVRGFSSATNTQRYFGTLVHDVLDRLSREHPRHATFAPPDETHVGELVQQAHDRLIRAGIRCSAYPPGARLRRQAL